ncbi:hypothetical protein cypCar_00004613 [Cyprinus carpio]|nr:hypothetical protein cypCar_00004613 [Cyprinus carpio]
MLAFGLTIVRHGETQCNKDGLLQGQKIDSPLSEIGIRQSEAAGQYLRDVKFTNVFVSNMKRAKQTAEIIVRNNRTCHDIELVADPSLKERVKVRIKDFLEVMFQRIASDHQDKIQDGETSIPDETDRALAGLPDDGVLNVPVHALVVGHGAYMSIAMRYFFEDVKCPMPRGLDAAQQYSICPNTGMCRFIITLKCSNADLALSDLKCVFINRRDHIKS